jgi:hypothetical protein
MSDAKSEAHQNVYLQNVVTGATTDPVMQNSDAIDEEFICLDGTLIELCTPIF